MSDDPFEAIKATFFQECEELLADLEGNLLTLESGSTDIEVINAVFRACLLYTSPSPRDS